MNVTFKPSSGIDVTLMPNGVGRFRVNVTFKRSIRVNVTFKRNGWSAREAGGGAVSRW
jgi:hypothetical protein